MTPARSAFSLTSAPAINDHSCLRAARGKAHLHAVIYELLVRRCRVSDRAAIHQQNTNRESGKLRKQEVVFLFSAAQREEKLNHYFLGVHSKENIWCLEGPRGELSVGCWLWTCWRETRAAKTLLEFGEKCKHALDLPEYSNNLQNDRSLGLHLRRRLQREIKIWGTGNNLDVARRIQMLRAGLHCVASASGAE